MNHKLTPEEGEKLRKAIAQITILIAGADGNIEKQELSWAKKISQIREYNHPLVLNDYYKSVGTDYDELVSSMISDLPDDTEARTVALTNALSELNPILAKLANDDAHFYYKSFVSFAEYVAKATGGILGFFSVSSEEKSLMSLPMITPIELDEVAEEEE